jgi:HSP20 family molecular chaperone IbpA
LSARWRRNKSNSRKFDILKVFSKVKGKNSQIFRTRNSRVKQRQNTYMCNVLRAPAEKRCREPKHLVDILEGTDEITVVADIAGYKREDLRVRVKGERLTLVAEALDHKYRKSLNLPKRVIPRTMRTTYKNGVLEIRLKKVEEKSMRKIAGYEDAA